MSNKYKHGDTVPTDVLCKRLDELAHAITKGCEAMDREFTMRIPAELDRDPDLVLSEAARRLKELEADAARFRWLLNGNGYFMEEEGICGHGPYDEQEQNEARAKIDEAMKGDY